MSVFYANKITLQISDSVRLIFTDERAPRDHYEVRNGGNLVITGGEEVVLTLQNARGLRDLLVEHVKDDPDAAAIVDLPVPH